MKTDIKLVCGSVAQNGFKNEKRTHVWFVIS